MSTGTTGRQSIQKIVQQGLCIGCGTCSALCPKGALAIVECKETGTYVPQLDYSKCSKCGLCLRVCPGVEPDFGKLNLTAFCQKPKNLVFGEFLKCYSGYATDQNMRRRSTSGGLVSALAKFALEDEIVDGVLTTFSDAKEPLRPQSFIARTSEEIISAAGSKYCPVAANLPFAEVLEKQGIYITVGLPCQIQGLRKAQAINKTLKNRISLVFGLVCNHTPTFHATDFLLKKFKIPQDRVAKIEYRSCSWPGGMRIIMKDSTEHFIPFISSYYWGYVFQRFFWPTRCMICNDKLCQLADIIFMDAWLPEFASDKTGVSLIAVRSKKGEDFISKAINKGIVQLQPASITDVMKSQSFQTTVRKVAARRYALNYNLEKSTAFQGLTHPHFFLDVLDAFHLILINVFCRNNRRLLHPIIEFHVRLWDFARSAKRTLSKP